MLTMTKYTTSHSSRQRSLVAAAIFAIALLVVVFIAAPFAASAQAAAPALTSAQIAAVDRVSGYLNSLQHMEGAFWQKGPDGTITDGQFHLRRPGRIRFEYAAPQELVVVADGTWVIIKEDADATPQRYPLYATPLNLLLTDNVNLRKDAEVRNVEQLPGTLKITLADPSGEAPGNITLIFDDPTLKLRQWIVNDAQGLQTIVVLQNTKECVKADNALFVMRDDSGPQKRR
ncbi:MAG: outer-membrane lipoprotein carrier protein LolA [Rhodobiaceae bacterium]|nr:outer-membrane lipoprotein carrier protein LolA [Rhodobiaceae bacterium]